MHAFWMEYYRTVFYGKFNLDRLGTETQLVCATKKAIAIK